MIQSSTGSLTILDAHTSTPKIYWNGVQVLGVVKLRVFDSTKDDESGEVRLRITKGANEASLLDALRAGGVTVKEVL